MEDTPSTVRSLSAQQLFAKATVAKSHEIYSMKLVKSTLNVICGIQSEQHKPSGVL